MNVFSLVIVLQHYLPCEIVDPAFVWVTLGCSSGTLTISSSSSQSNASHMRSRCSRFTLSTNSWYNSLIVLGLIPVALAKSAWVHLTSPSFVDSKIRIIRCRPFRYKITLFDTFVFFLLFYSVFCYILSDIVIGACMAIRILQGTVLHFDLSHTEHIPDRDLRSIQNNTTSHQSAAS